MFELPKLDYDLSALNPIFSEETMNYHYNKHHKAYIDNLNKLIKDSPLEDLSLEAILQASSGTIYNNAAQHWNHAFFWKCLSPLKTSPSNELLNKIIKSFGSIENFKSQFSKEALALFGSGWAWLIEDESKQLKIVTTSNAEVPMFSKNKILLTCDLWEHAYYIDFRNDRKKYLEEFWNIVNWNFLNSKI